MICVWQTNVNDPADFGVLSVRILPIIVLRSGGDDDRQTLYIDHIL